MKSSEKEIALCVETPEIMNAIIIDTNRANIIGSKRELGSENTFTNFRAIGTTVSKIGKAIGQLFPHATIQDVKKPSEKEIVLKVEIPATIHDIVSDTIKLNKIGAKREGSFILFGRPVLVSSFLSYLHLETDAIASAKTIAAGLTLWCGFVEGIPWMLPPHPLQLFYCYSNPMVASSVWQTVC